MEMKHLLILAMASGLTACAGMGPPVEHTVQSVETTLPKVWYAPPLPHQGQTASMTDWWARLGDAQLPALIADAQRGSASIMTARAQVFAARAALAGADSATLPQVALEAGAYRGVSASAPLGTGMNAGLQASWALDVWGQNASSVRQASAQVAAAQAGWHEARVLMAAETARLYLGWRSCLAQKAVIDSDRASRTVTAQSAADTERAGLLAPATAALARAGQADAESRLAQQNRQCEQQFKAIVALVGADEAERAIDSENVQWFWADELPSLAFDHNQIVQYALGRLRNKLEYSRIAHVFLSASFTLAQLREVYEAVLGRELDPGNFRRMVESTGTVEETGEVLAGTRHRPPKLYRATIQAGETK